LVKVIGPLLGGSIASIFSPQIARALNGCAVIVSGLILLCINVQENPETNVTTETREPFFQAWKEGWRIIWHSQILRASIIFGMFSTLTIQMIDVQVVSLFSIVFPSNPGFTGWVISAVGIGSLVIVILLNRFKKLTKFGWFFGLGSLLIGVMATGLGFLSVFNFTLLAISLAVLGGIGNGLTFTAINYLIQSEPPKEAIGRITGIIDSLMSVLFIAGPLLGGFLITQLGVLTTFKAIGFTLIFIGFIGIVLQRFIWKEREIKSSTANTEEALQ
ncbi:MAG: MFS transporter, partial [Lysinibacillus sp.]